MIPVSEPWFLEEDAACVAECVRTGWVSSAGPAVADFEAAWAAYCERAFGVAVSSGTTALQLSINALDLRPGDEVIIPAFTIISCALAVIYGGGTPVLIDADPNTWCLDVSCIEARITPRTKAIMPVHIYGHPVNMAPLLKLAEKYGLAVIEDSAEAHGAEYFDGATWRRCGCFGRMSCFSFYANKLIATGEGGMIVTDDEPLAQRLRSLRDLCFDPKRRFVHPAMGYNYRLTNLQAALGRNQVDRMPELLRRKRRMAEIYRRLLADIPGLEHPPEMSWARSMYWMYGIVLGQQHHCGAVDFAVRLRQLGVDTRPFFAGMHQQPALLERGLFAGESYPQADRLAERGLYLPSGLGTSESQFEQVSEAVHRVLDV